MERLGGDGKLFPSACFTCPARTYVGGNYFCDAAVLDNPNLIIPVGRFRPDKCPSKVEPKNGQFPPEILLRKMLGR